MDDLLADFLTETNESIAELGVALVRLERTPDDAQTLSLIFRLVHTIKGTCGFLGLGRLEKVAHAAENVLGKLRDNTLTATLAGRLRAPGAEALIREVVEAMTTNESFFFRDDKPFQHVRKEALPRLIAARPPGSTIRIWSAASSSGQEAYSLAMLIQEARASMGERRVEIIGTDIAREQLTRAQTGIYTQFEIQRGLPMQMLVKYFQKSPPNWQVNDTIRKMVQFREWNLLDDLRPLGQFDIVFCRNVLIYFDLPTKTRVLDAIGRQMRPDAMLYLGGAETVMGVSTQFAPMATERGVYVRTPEVTARPRAAVG